MSLYGPASGGVRGRGRRLRARAGGNHFVSGLAPGSSALLSAKQLGRPQASAPSLAAELCPLSPRPIPFLPPRSLCPSGSGQGDRRCPSAWRRPHFGLGRERGRSRGAAVSSPPEPGRPGLSLGAWRGG